MQLLCKTIGDALIVIATHDDGQAIDAGAYGEGVIALPYAGSTAVADLIGRPIPQIDLGEYASARRYAVETGGIVVSGARVRTDRGSQSLLTAAYTRARENPDRVISYKTEGGFVKLPGSQVIALGTAVGDHVQACFDVEEAIDAGLSASPPTILSTADVDAAFAHLIPAPPAA